MSHSENVENREGIRLRGGAAVALELACIGVLYFAFAKAGLSVASINPSATPIWPPTGLALAAVLLRGYRVAPVIAIAAFVANVTTAGTVLAAAAIGAGNMLEAVAGAWLVNRWSEGRNTFATAVGVAKFSLIACLPTALCATIGVFTLAAAGLADQPALGSIWLTWWLGDLAGALLITPLIVLWANAGWPRPSRQDVFDSIAMLAGTCVIGLIVFSPLVEQTDRRAPLGFLAVLPLLWSALRRGQRETAMVALTLTAFAVWGTLSGTGPFARETLNESFLTLLMFIISTTVPSLVLSADAAVRRQTEDELRRTQQGLNQMVEQRTAALQATNITLQQEVERRKRVEGELEEQRLFLLEAQRLAKLGSWVRDVEQDKVTWSEQLYEIFGIKPGEEFAVSFGGYLGRIHPDDRELVRQEIARALATGEGFHAERRIIRPSGEVRHLQTSVELIKDDQGRVKRMHGISLDVTERKVAETALEQTREQLAHVHKMEAIGQLTGGIAHDFNNLLMIVSGHAEMLRRRLTDPKQARGLDAILTAAKRGESLTRQLLTFSRRQPLNPVPVDLRHRLDALRPMLESSLRGNITLALDLPDELWPVDVDILELELALVNIAVNARDAMPQGGTFTVSVRNVAVPPGRRVAHLTRDHVAIALSDNGSGIAPDVIKKIFDPFFTTKAVGKGTGLGLSQVYGFANQSGGVVQVQSDLGRGTTVSVFLPRGRAEAAAALAAASPPAVARADGTILVVEDNADVGEVTATLLEQIGYRVLRAENATEALQRLQGDQAIDVLFSDIVMPNGMNGIHLAQEVSVLYPHIRVLLTTGYSDVAVSAESRFQILRKPFEVSALERAIQDAMTGPAGRTARRAAQ